MLSMECSPCYTADMEQTDQPGDVRNLQSRLADAMDSAGLNWLMEALSEASQPLAPLFSQLVWIAQPLTSGLVETEPDVPIVRHASTDTNRETDA